MPKVKLEEALLELDEDRGTQEQVGNLLAFGTDDPKKVEALMANLEACYQRAVYDPDWFDDLLAYEVEADIIDDW